MFFIFSPPPPPRFTTWTVTIQKYQAPHLLLKFSRPRLISIRTQVNLEAGMVLLLQHSHLLLPPPGFLRLPDMPRRWAQEAGPLGGRRFWGGAATGGSFAVAVPVSLAVVVSSVTVVVAVVVAEVVAVATSKILKREVWLNIVNVW